jgi:membrane protein DedA with SNARE-associated domain
MKQLNLYLACIWVLLGGGALMRPDVLPQALQPIYLHLAVFAGVMVCYNLTRWWLMRLQARYAREAEEPSYRRRAHRTEPIDPTFDLGDDPTREH